MAKGRKKGPVADFIEQTEGQQGQQMVEAHHQEVDKQLAPVVLETPHSETNAPAKSSATPLSEPSDPATEFDPAKLEQPTTTVTQAEPLAGRDWSKYPTPAPSTA